MFYLTTRRQTRDFYQLIAGKYRIPESVIKRGKKPRASDLFNKTFSESSLFIVLVCDLGKSPSAVIKSIQLQRSTFCVKGAEILNPHNESDNVINLDITLRCRNKYIFLDRAFIVYCD